MSLSDLKKPGKRKKAKKLSVDEFIDGATAYSQGRAEKRQPASARKYKNATFSLRIEQIEQLTKLSRQLRLNKSKIIRRLIFDAYQNPDFIEDNS